MFADYLTFSREYHYQSNNLVITNDAFIVNNSASGVLFYNAKLISQFPPTDQTTVAIFYQIGINF